MPTEPLLQPVSPAQKARQLRQLLENSLKTGQAVPIPGAFNALCAKLVEQTGFPAVYISGAGINNTVAGYPDIGMMSLDEMAREAGYIARAVNIPAIADADTGFGESIQTYRTIQEYERQGLVGLHLEDQVFPKRCGHLNGKQVIEPEAMITKIQAALKARQNPDFLVIARVDSKSVLGFDDALERAIAYVSAGAPMIFAEALETEDEFRLFAQKLRAVHPQALLLANMTEFGKSPYLTLQAFGELGYNGVIYPLTAFRVMLKAVQHALQVLKTSGTQQALLDQMLTRQELYQLIQYDAYEALDQSLLGR